MGTHNLCFEQKYKKYQSCFVVCLLFLFLKIFSFWSDFFIYIYICVFVMCYYCYSYFISHALKLFSKGTISYMDRVKQKSAFEHARNSQKFKASCLCAKYHLGLCSAFQPSEGQMNMLVDSESPDETAQCSG